MNIFLTYSHRGDCWEISEVALISPCVFIGGQPECIKSHQLPLTWPRSLIQTDSYSRLILCTEGVSVCTHTCTSRSFTSSSACGPSSRNCTQSNWFGVGGGFVNRSCLQSKAAGQVSDGKRKQKRDDSMCNTLDKQGVISMLRKIFFFFFYGDITFLLQLMYNYIFIYSV